MRDKTGFFLRINIKRALNFINIKARSNLIAKILISNLVLKLKGTVFKINNNIILFEHKVIAAKRKSLNIFIILYYYLYD